MQKSNEYYDLMLKRREMIRELITHEDRLISERTTRLLTAQTILFSLFVLSPEDGWKYLVVPLLGIAFALSSLSGLFAASRALAELQKWWDVRYREETYFPSIIGYTKDPGLGRVLTSALAPPIIVALGWVALFWFEAEKARGAWCQNAKVFTHICETDVSAPTPEVGEQ